METLVKAVLQVLDDMGDDGLSCCEEAKANLRIAVEPFLKGDDREWIMPLPKAEQVRRECDAMHRRGGA